VNRTDPLPPRYLAPDECQVCGWYPASPVRRVTMISLLLAWRVSQTTSRLCRSCGIALTRRAQANSLGFGMWGLGILGAVVAVFRNSAELQRLHTALPPPQGRRPGIWTERTTPLAPGVPVLLYVRSWLFLGTVVLGTIVNIMVAVSRQAH
jgi:hypothetical protein